MTAALDAIAAAETELASCRTAVVCPDSAQVRFGGRRLRVDLVWDRGPELRSEPSVFALRWLASPGDDAGLEDLAWGPLSEAPEAIRRAAVSLIPALLEEARQSRKATAPALVLEEA